MMGMLFALYFGARPKWLTVDQQDGCFQLARQNHGLALTKNC
jgi:hypothetical protein